MLERLSEKLVAGQCLRPEPRNGSGLVQGLKLEEFLLRAYMPVFRDQVLRFFAV